MRQTIQLQNADRSHSRYIGPLELESLLNSGRVHVFYKGSKKKQRLIARYLPQPEPLRSMDEASAPSITYADILANVGLTADPHSTRQLTRGRQKRVQEKIAAFAPTYRFAAATA